jgi:hypothetical protein
MKKILINFVLLLNILYANENLSIKDITIQNVTIKKTNILLDIKKCSDAIEIELIKNIESFKGLSSFETKENLDKTITTTPVYQDYKIGEETVIKACERKEGIIELDIEKNNYDISNKETIIK